MVRLDLALAGHQRVFERATSAFTRVFDGASGQREHFGVTAPAPRVLRATRLRGERRRERRPHHGVKPRKRGLAPAQRALAGENLFNALAEPAVNSFIAAAVPNVDDFDRQLSQFRQLRRASWIELAQHDYGAAAHRGVGI